MVYTLIYTMRLKYVFLSQPRLLTAVLPIVMSNVCRVFFFFSRERTTSTSSLGPVYEFVCNSFRTSNLKITMINNMVCV